MKDPVLQDEARYLRDQEAREGIDGYIVDHGHHPCSGCESDCRICGVKNYRHYRRGESNVPISED
jgi:hypothetical protein